MEGARVSVGRDVLDDVTDDGFLLEDSNSSVTDDVSGGGSRGSLPCIVTLNSASCFSWSDEGCVHVVLEDVAVLDGAVGGGSNDGGCIQGLCGYSGL